MHLAIWIAIGFGFGFVLGAATDRIGLWGWMNRRWKEDLRTPPASDFKPVPLKFRRLPPPR